MNRVDGIGNAAIIGGSRAKAALEPGGGFAVEAAGPEGPEGLAQTQAALPTGLAGMLALQEAETEMIGNRNGRRHGLAVLDALQELQHGLLKTVGSKADEIAGLARLAENMPAVADTGLEAVLSAIRLRAKIELLRRGAETG